MKPNYHNHPETHNLAKESFKAQEAKKLSYNELEKIVEAQKKQIKVMWQGVARKNEVIEVLRTELLKIQIHRSE